MLGPIAGTLAWLIGLVMLIVTIRTPRVVYERAGLSKGTWIYMAFGLGLVWLGPLVAVGWWLFGPRIVPSGPDRNGLQSPNRSTEQQLDQLRKAAHFAGIKMSDEQCRGLVEDWVGVGVLARDGVVLGAFLGSALSALANPRPVWWFLTDTHLITIESTMAGLRPTGAVYDLGRATIRRTDDYVITIAERGQRTRQIRLGTPTGPVFNSTPDQAGLARASELERVVREAQWALRNSTRR